MMSMAQIMTMELTNSYKMDNVRKRPRKGLYTSGVYQMFNNKDGGLSMNEVGLKD